MATVTVSPKYQVVIPKSAREGLALAPGDKVDVIQLDGRVEIVPVRPMKSMRGFLKGLKNTFEREKDRCLPLADGIIYATARDASAELLTQDAALEGLPGVVYVKHSGRKA